LLAPTEGKALLFGRPLDAADMATRERVGYMTQAFSLYGELTVRQNLDLHSHLFHLPENRRAARVRELLDRFDLLGVADSRPESLPLGQKQRLQLAVAVLHGPEVLILDEPTSGVDPVARDSFWRTLISLSRDDGVTIFLSTHFMNEAERCDRISLMNAGKVLAVGTAKELTERRGMERFEDAFIAYLEDAGGRESKPSETAPSPEPTWPAASRASVSSRFDLRRLWAYARRETMEILRDPIRLTFAIAGPLILMVTIGYGISFDVEHLAYAVFDQDQTTQSRELLENFAGSRYFTEHPDIVGQSELEHRLKSGELKVALEIPPNFGKDLVADKQPEISVWLDGAMPFRAETASGYVSGLGMTYLTDQAARGHITNLQPMPVNVEERFRYNQAFKSIYQTVPATIMLVLILIPAMMTAVGVAARRRPGRSPISARRRSRASNSCSANNCHTS